MRRSLPRPAGLALGLGLLALLAFAPPLSRAALVPAGGAPDLIILFTGDVQGYVEPCG